MDFSELLATASDNAKEVKHKIKKLSVHEQEKHEKFRKKQEKILLEKRLKLKVQKEREARKPKTPSPPPLEKNRIPKLSLKNRKESGPSKDAVSSFLARKSAEKDRAEREKIKKRNELLEARIKANGGKVSKKIVEQFHLSPGDIKRLLSGIPTQESSQKRREELEKSRNPKADRMHEKFMSEVRNSSSKNDIIRNAKSDKPSVINQHKSHHSLGQQPRQRDKSKLKPAPPVDFRELMMKAATIQQKVESGEISKTPSPSPEPEPTPKQKPHSISRKEAVYSDKSSQKLARPSKNVQNYEKSRKEANSNSSSKSDYSDYLTRYYKSSKKPLPTGKSGEKREKAPKDDKKMPPSKSYNGPTNKYKGTTDINGKKPDMKRNLTKEGAAGRPGGRQEGVRPPGGGESGGRPALKRPPRPTERPSSSKYCRTAESYKYMDRERLESIRDRYRPPNNQLRGNRPIDDSLESDEEYDSEMEDFIDDTETYGDPRADLELRRTLKEKFRYDKEKFRGEVHDRWTDASMVASYRDIDAEEKRSAKIAKMEDEIELIREQKELEAQLKKLKGGKK